MTSKYVKDAAESARTELEARRDRARKNLRDAAHRFGGDPKEAVEQLNRAYAEQDRRGES